MEPENITLVLALLAGLLSFVSPCVLPLMPVYLGYLTGLTVSDHGPKKRYYVISHALAFIVGFTIIFVLIGATLGLIAGTFFRSSFSDFIMIIGGSLLLVLGLHMSGILRALQPHTKSIKPIHNILEWTNRVLDEWILPERRYQQEHGEAPGYIRSGLIGMGFAAGWSPCVGPLLSAILTLSIGATAGPEPLLAVMKSATLLFVYSMGLAIPFFLTALLLNRATGVLKALNRRGHIVEKISAFFLILVGLLLLSGSMGKLNQYFSASPDWIYDLESRLIE
ncbi:MAG: hypothetical protein GXP09_01125 [Gammaproteobacteria bacterium]|nr:hypothetical protein [Gammaproteobacteria bacterium]